MANKSWSVTTDEGTFSVDLKGNKVSINGGAPERLTRFAKKTHFVDTEYTIPLGNRAATLFIQSMAAPILAYNGHNCATGEPWEYQKIPAWGIVFLVLDLLTILYGSWIISAFALIVTAVVIRSKLNTGIKILLSILLIVGTLVLQTVLALAVVSMI
ncbi:MAG: hypothetical protein K2P64_12555 [Lachnospiraceae bacterium]|nr:hypothetical protein [Lachnospiraceae bacterium]